MARPRLRPSTTRRSSRAPPVLLEPWTRTWAGSSLSGSGSTAAMLRITRGSSVTMPLTTLLTQKLPDRRERLDVVADDLDRRHDRHGEDRAGDAPQIPP